MQQQKVVRLHSLVRIFVKGNVLNSKIGKIAFISVGLVQCFKSGGAAGASEEIKINLEKRGQQHLFITTGLGLNGDSADLLDVRTWTYSTTLFSILPKLRRASNSNTTILISYICVGTTD